MKWIEKNTKKPELNFAPSLEFEYWGEVYILDKNSIYESLEKNHKFWLVYSDNSVDVARVMKNGHRNGLVKQVYTDGTVEYKLFGDKIVNLGYISAMQKNIDRISARHNASRAVKLAQALGDKRCATFKAHGHLNKCEVKSL